MGTDDRHPWLVAEAALSAMDSRIVAYLRGHGVRNPHDRNDIRSDTIINLRKQFEKECPIGPADLQPDPPRFRCEEHSLPLVEGLVWRIVNQRRVDLLRKRRHTCRHFHDGEQDALPARSSNSCHVDIYEVAGSDFADQAILKLLLAGEKQEAIARILGVDRSTVSRRKARMRKALCNL